MRIIYYFNKLRSLISFKESLNEGSFELHIPKIEDMSNVDSFEFKVNFNNEILNYISKNRESFSRTVKFLPINEKEDDLSLVIPDIVDMDQGDI